jgi:uracil-DNA glycosylase family 4
MKVDQKTFQNLVTQVHQCVRCERMASSCRIFGRSSGEITAPLMFIGEAPGRFGADDTSIPFHGDRAGENFEKLIAQVGISRYDCFITNAVLCNPRDEKGNNATPSRQEVANCSSFLKAQIDLIGPKIIATLGNQALHALKLIELHACELSKDVRKPHFWYGRTLIPLYHPGQRAMLHRSFFNQLADYRFLAEQLSNITKGPKRAAARGKTSLAAANIVRSILEASGAITYFRLHKLFYMLEYHHVRRTGRRLTHSYAIRQKDGPYFVDLHISKLKRAIPDLEISTKAGALWLTLKQSVDLFQDKSTDDEFLCFIAAIIERYRVRTDDELKTAVYLTSPMRSLLRKEKYGGASLFNAPIDFTAARQKPRDESTLTRASK